MMLPAAPANRGGAAGCTGRSGSCGAAETPGAAWRRAPAAASRAPRHPRALRPLRRAAWREADAPPAGCGLRRDVSRAATAATPRTHSADAMRARAAAPPARLDAAEAEPEQHAELPPRRNWFGRRAAAAAPDAGASSLEVRCCGAACDTACPLRRMRILPRSRCADGPARAATAAAGGGRRERERGARRPRVASPHARCASTAAAPAAATRARG
jgi:hypothetical protein